MSCTSPPLSSQWERGSGGEGHGGTMTATFAKEERPPKGPLLTLACGRAYDAVRVREPAAVM